MTKIQNNKGFTLIELLMVMAIISILVGVAIPAYSGQMENTRVSVDQKTVRSAASIAAFDYILNDYIGLVSYGIIVDESDVNSVSVEANVPHRWSPVSTTYTTSLSTINLVISDGGVVIEATVIDP